MLRTVRGFTPGAAFCANLRLLSPLQLANELARRCLASVFTVGIRRSPVPRLAGPGGMTTLVGGLRDGPRRCFTRTVP